MCKPLNINNLNAVLRIWDENYSLTMFFGNAIANAKDKNPYKAEELLDDLSIDV